PTRSAQDLSPHRAQGAQRKGSALPLEALFRRAWLSKHDANQRRGARVLRRLEYRASGDLARRLEDLSPVAPVARGRAVAVKAVCRREFPLLQQSDARDC